MVLTTNHTAFDVEFIQQHAKMIVDLRNMVKEASDSPSLVRICNPYLAQGLKEPTIIICNQAFGLAHPLQTGASGRKRLI